MAVSSARPGCYIDNRHPSHYHLRRHLRGRYSGDDNLPQSCSDDRCEQYRLTLVNDASTEHPSGATDVRPASPSACQEMSALLATAGKRLREPYTGHGPGINGNILEMSCLSAALMSQYIGHYRRIVRLVVFPLFVDFVAVSVRHRVAR